LHPTSALWDCLAADPELSRSLWDRRSLVADVDFEHVHFDRPWVPLHTPARSRGLLRPAIRALEELLAAAGVPTLQVLTGRGRHVLWRVARTAFVALAAGGRRAAPGARRIPAANASSPSWRGLNGPAR
jgi:hypothetical protein